jgi:kumamolisin
MRRPGIGRPGRRSGALGLVLAALVVAGGSGAALAVLAGATPRPAPTGAGRALGATDPRTIVDFSLVLRAAHGRRLSRFLAALEDPASPSYHHFLGARAFGRRFGLPIAELRRVRRRLRADGVRITGSYPQRTALDVTAPARVVERVFGTRLVDYAGAGGRRLHAPAGSPTVPAALSGAVSAVAGLDQRAAIRPEDVPSGGLAPSDAALAYGIRPLWRAGIQGQGQTIAILSFSDYDPSSLSGFDGQFGLPPATVADRSAPAPLGAAGDGGAAGRQEVELDLEIAHAIAPRATVVDYNAPFVDASGDDTLGTLLDLVVADGRAKVVSDSWGTCELTTPTADIERDERAIEAAVAAGVSIFKSTGDAGAYQCQRASQSDHRLSVEWPASSPGVIGVGGTSLSVARDGSYRGETAWEDTLSQGGGGGGLSAYFRRPSWQSGPGVINRFSNGHRQVPDVSAAADPANGWAAFGGGTLGEEGGTSAASPFWAAAMALVTQYAAQHGVHAVGFAAPALYALAARGQPAPPFHDVTTGSNRHYPASPGWDFATGLGSPDVANLARDLTSYLRGGGARG